jgi:RNase P/RNase MRP subunit p29
MVLEVSSSSVGGIRGRVVELEINPVVIGSAIIVVSYNVF